MNKINKLERTAEEKWSNGEDNTFVLIQSNPTNIPSSFIISMGDPPGAWHAGIHESKQD